ncbi:MAG: dsDNA nuclease domain-containing protein, partial [Ignavibacteria bacterium]|nr:dsDNA nuclease domain-containing protein [Ignavibacteria bacterium]
MMLKDKIVNTKPREKAGSTSASRFDYQKDYSICKLIESHLTSNDYIIIFDWHEDLIIMDSELNPQTVSFYQIKGKKTGTWTIKQL